MTGRVAEGSRGRRAYVDGSLMLVAAAWGSTYWVAKELITGQTVLALLAVRMVLAAVALGAVVAVRGRRLRGREVRVGVVLGLLLASVFILETFGIAATGGPHLSRWFYAAGLIAVAGIYLLSSGGAYGGFGLGDWLVLGAAGVRAVHVVTMHRRSAGTDQDSLNLTLVQMATCGAVFVLGSSAWGTAAPTYVAALDRTALFQLAYLVIGCTVFPFLVQMWAVRRTSPTRVSLLLGTEPVWAAVVGVTLAGDAFGVTGVVGIVIVIAGVEWGQVIESRRRPSSATDPLADAPVPASLTPTG